MTMGQQKSTSRPWATTDYNEEMANTTPPLTEAQRDFAKEFRAKIPVDFGEDTEEYKIYEKLILPLANRDPLDTPRVLVITDIEQDYDDLFAIIFLSEMHRLGVIELIGCIANHEPAAARAYFLRAVLDLLNLSEVPVAVGTSGANPPEDRKLYSYELRNETFIQCGRQAMQHGPEDGGHLIDKLAKEVSEKGKAPITVLLLSALQDISEYFDKYKNNPQFLKGSFKKFVSQGGYIVSDEGKVTKSSNRNMDFNISSADKYTEYLTKFNLPSDTWTRRIAVAGLLPHEVIEVAGTRGPIGQHINWVWLRQEFEFHWRAQNAKHLADRGPEWYMNIKMGVPVAGINEASVKKSSSFIDILPTLKVIVYDGYAAMGTLGDDVLKALEVFPDNGELEPYNMKEHKHRVFGREGDGVRLDDYGGVDVAKAGEVLKVFFLGALHATYEQAKSRIPTVELVPETYTDTNLEVFPQQLPHYQEWNDRRLDKIKADKQGDRKKRKGYEAKMKEIQRRRLEVNGRVYMACPADPPLELLYKQFLEQWRQKQKQKQQQQAGNGIGDDDCASGEINGNTGKTGNDTRALGQEDVSRKRKKRESSESA